MRKRGIAATLMVGIAVLGVTAGTTGGQAEGEFVPPAEGTVAWCGWADAWGEDARCDPTYTYTVDGLILVAEYPNGEVTHTPEVSLYEDGSWTHGAQSGCVPSGLCND